MLIYKLPVEVVNVVGIVDEGWAEQHIESQIGIIFNGVAAETASFEGVTNFAFDLTGGQCIKYIDRQLTEVSGVPQCELGGSTVFNIFAHLVGGAQTCDKHLADQVLIRDGAGRSSNTHCGRGNDDL